ncbi:hypothetical protein [Dyadobacter sandarakinus]|uniref:Uncharacterized protein n=1 Tax=Dyadobacter sandarakinus TaxID=2747268 RepID=A0ABX7I6X3_9BACT|nr:hypothetical protein [Dyadobacter sandarakinus]QRR01227.1 hypothetical protein HWI92_10080 [Dyadobacter sandarakinus]
MNWFIAGVVVHVCGIILVAANALIDHFNGSSSDNAAVNLLGLAMVVILGIAFALKSSGMLAAANILLWIPGFPMAILFLFFLFYLILSYCSGTGWQ